MLVIGHRGAAGLAQENTLDALRTGMRAGADILEFDIRLTKDHVPVIAHDFHTLRTHRNISIILYHTLEELREMTKDQPIITLQEVLDEFFGRILLNIELKGRGSGKIVASLIKKQYIKIKSDWDKVLFSSFHGNELANVRRISSAASLSLLHSSNPFIFIAYHRRLRLSAVGFHRLYLNSFALEIAKRAGLFIYAYTINRPHSAFLLSQQGIDGIVTDRPDIILDEIQKRAH